MIAIGDAVFVGYICTHINLLTIHLLYENNIPLLLLEIEIDKYLEDCHKYNVQQN